MNEDKRFSPAPAALALAANARQHFAPPVPVDAAAAAHLFDLLYGAALELAAIPCDVVAVGSAPDKFNDAGWGAWQLVRAGRAAAEFDSYFSDRASMERALAQGTPELRSAAKVLDQLESRGWRSWWLQAYGLPLREEFLALIVQDGAPWFLYATSNAGDRDHAFALWQGPGLVYVGECVERMDEELSDTSAAPLRLLPPEEPYAPDEQG